MSYGRRKATPWKKARCEKGDITLRKGPFRIAERPFLHHHTARLAPRYTTATEDVCPVQAIRTPLQTPAEAGRQHAR